MPHHHQHHHHSYKESYNPYGQCKAFKCTHITWIIVNYHDFYQVNSTEKQFFQKSYYKKKTLLCINSLYIFVHLVKRANSVNETSIDCLIDSRAKKYHLSMYVSLYVCRFVSVHHGINGDIYTWYHFLSYIIIQTMTDTRSH